MCVCVCACLYDERSGGFPAESGAEHLSEISKIQASAHTLLGRTPPVSVLCFQHLPAAHGRVTEEGGEGRLEWRCSNYKHRRSFVYTYRKGVKLGSPC